MKRRVLALAAVAALMAIPAAYAQGSGGARGTGRTPVERIAASQHVRPKTPPEHRLRPSAQVHQLATRSPTPTEGTGYAGPILSLIRRVFGPALSPVALCIARRESGLEPRARNPRPWPPGTDSHATGLFQEINMWWDGSTRGYPPIDPYDPWANARVARHLHDDHGGWGQDWAAQRGVCF